MVQIYNNFLIVSRNEIIPGALELAKTLGAYFQDETNVWHIKNPHDKVILIYDHIFDKTDNITDYKSSNEINFTIPHQKYIGFIRLYCHGTNVKISDFKFKPTVIDSTLHWLTLKKYLIQTIKDLGVSQQTISQHKFTLFWNKSICSNSIMSMAIKNGLLSDKNRKLYVFTGSDLGQSNNSDIFASSLWGMGSIQPQLTQAQNQPIFPPKNLFGNFF